MSFDYTDFNLTMYRGDYMEWGGVIKDANDDPLDITGWDLWFTGKLDREDTDLAAVFQLTIGAGITVADPTLGEYVIALEAADTDALTELSTSLFCDLQTKDTADKPRTLRTGMLTVIGEITRTTT